MAISVSTQEVRDLSGVPTDLIDDTQLERIITVKTIETLSYFNIYADPTKVLEIKDGNSKNEIKVNRPYILKLLKLESTDENINIQNTTIDPYSGIITIDNTQNPYYFYGRRNSVKIKYLSGFMEKTNIITETSAAVEDDTNVAISVDDESDFSINDWIMIEGLDGKREVAKITATSSNQITVDELVQDHESGSIITKLKTHTLLNEFVKYLSAVTAAINIVGSSYTIATSYSFPEYSITKGVPYPHWDKNGEKNQKQLQIIKNQLYNKLSTIA